ncbi:hypothetical protein ACFYP4_03365 [Streptomyces sp. NPDC005551]|uniref:hypothetical protein n=1 Tax=Streptomyces sp. NPDC005551 TaxID=3364725 RepID=UPI0036990E43
MESDEALSLGAYPGSRNDVFAVFPDGETGFHGSNDPQRYARQVVDTIRRVEAWWPDPDDLYITTRGNGSTGSVNSDHDSASDDDRLGSTRIEASERGVGSVARLASSPVKRSAYYVTYLVD